MPANARSYHFVLIAPEGNVSIACLGELMETMAFGLQALGCSTTAELNAFRPEAINIVLGAHLLPRGFDAIAQDSIIYNSEQIFPGCPALMGALAELVARHETWDYSRRNIEAWKTLNCHHVRHLPTGHVPNLSRIASVSEQDIDVLFYGAVNPRRRQVLEALKAHGVALEVVGGVYGAQRDALIARSKVVLNLHYYPSHIFETARVSYLLANRKAVVAEVNPDTEIDERYAAAVEGRPYAGLVQACLDLLNDPAARRAREERGYVLMQSMPAQDFLAPLIAQRVLPDTATADHTPAPASTTAPESELCLVTRQSWTSHEPSCWSRPMLMQWLRGGPPSAKRALFIGPRSGLGQAYAELHPQCDCVQLDMAQQAGTLPSASFDLLLLSCLDQGSEGDALLELARKLLKPGAPLWLVLENACSEENLVDLMAGDRRPGAQAGHHPATLIKRLLDAGWLAHRHSVPPGPGSALATALKPAAESVRMSELRLRHQVQQNLLVVECFDWPAPPSSPDLHAPPPISVVVAVNDHRQLHKNVLASPGLRELDLPVYAVEYAASAAQALVAGKARVQGGWILFCHQDVYFPRGFGAHLLSTLAEIPPRCESEAILGLIGLAKQKNGSLGPAGIVSDRGSILQGAPGEVISLDEFAILVHSSCIYQIDASLGWHLWATDLCLQAMHNPEAMAPRAVQALAFHNSYSDWTLPSAFQASLARLFEKYPELERITSLCGDFLRPQSEQAREEQPAA